MICGYTYWDSIPILLQSRNPVDTVDMMFVLRAADEYPAHITHKHLLRSGTLQPYKTLQW